MMSNEKAHLVADNLHPTKPIGVQQGPQSNRNPGFNVWSHLARWVGRVAVLRLVLWISCIIPRLWILECSESYLDGYCVDREPLGLESLN
jgi:hypothetical protein